MIPPAPLETTDPLVGSEASRQLPSGWVWRELGSFGEIVGGGTPSRSVPGYWSGRIPWASVKDFSDDSTVLEDTAEHVTEEAVRGSAATLVPSGTPVVCTRMAVGRCALTSQPTAINQDLKAFLLNEDTDAGFFVRLLHLFGHQLDRVSVGSTVRGISLRDLKSLAVPCPGRQEEQVRIAEILGLVDALIRQSEEGLRKLKMLRIGLLHDLLTCVIDENGELRDLSSQPASFDQAFSHNLPVSWESRSLSSLAPKKRPYLRTGPFGSSLKQQHWTTEGIPVVTIGAIGQEEFIRSELLFVSTETAQALHAYTLLPGDIVFSRVADVGRCAVVTEAEAGWIMSSNLMCVSLDMDKVNPRYAQLQFSYGASIRYQVRKLVNSAGREVANAATLNAIKLPLPLRFEQDEIVARIQALDTAIDDEQRQHEKLLALKLGLSHDLLTGRVRVPEDALEQDV